MNERKFLQWLDRQVERGREWNCNPDGALGWGCQCPLAQFLQEVELCNGAQVAFVSYWAGGERKNLPEWAVKFRKAADCLGFRQGTFTAEELRDKAYLVEVIG